MYDAIAVKLHKELDKLTTDVCAVPHAFTMNPALWDRQERDSIDGLKRLRVAVPALTELVALLTELVEFLAPVRVGKQRELQAVKDLIPFYDFTGVQSPMLVEIARNLPNVPVVSVEMATYLKNFNVFFCVHPLDARHAVENELNGQALNWTEQDGRLIPANEARDLPGGVEFPVWSGTTIQ
ncbi:hypothetical protein AVL48_04965 [Amycolatopsis regifaucium]|uniref:Uncharacterized protein n=2 Tax=Amycolatopsis regifaucium TaxID=546365 RepID=A0A154MAJ9_9PSEU|nr:hypothetical protein AVL48_04965 [Amycolatopsis regifaucium]OKA04637.1 hypothetical protein ATP06_0229980 [Amycolatopsis regifaucium]